MSNTTSDTYFIKLYSIHSYDIDPVSTIHHGAVVTFWANKYQSSMAYNFRVLKLDGTGPYDHPNFS